MIEEMLDMQIISELLAPRAMVYLVVSLVLLFLAKKSFDLIASYDVGEQLTKKDNKAVALSLGGFLFGAALIIISVLNGEPQHGAAKNMALAYATDIGATIAWTLGGILLLHLGRVINDKAVLYRFNNDKEIVEDQNLGTGAIEAGNYIAVALIVHATLSGDSDSLREGVISTAAFFTTAQVLFVVFALAYQKVTRYDLHQEVEADNAAAGLSFGLNLAALGVLFAGYIQDHDSLVGMAIWGVVGSLLLLVLRYMVDKLLLPGNLLDEEIKDDRNWGAALVEGASALGLAFILNACFLVS